MSTSSEFNTMLKEFMPFELLSEEMARRNYIWGKVKKDETWMGGQLDVPFEGGEYSTIQFSSLAASNDVGVMAPIKGYVTAYPELWGTMRFYEKDLDLHGDMKASFLKILPNKLEQFAMRMTDTVSLSLINGWKAKLTATSDVGGAGLLTVDHPERFTIGEKFTLDDDNSATKDLYVIAININTKVITVSDSRGGSAYNLSGAYAVANGAKLYIPGTNESTAGFTSLRTALLSAANGGAASLHNQTKVSYPFLQALNISGAAITASNVLEKFFDAMMDTLSLGKGNPTSIICSYKHFANCAKSIEVSRQYTITDKAAGFGFRKINVLGAEGEMEIIGLRDLDDDIALIMDWNAVTFFGSHFFDRKRHLDGNEFFLERATTGYSYLVDIRFFGDLVVHNPSHLGIIHSISY